MKLRNRFFTDSMHISNITIRFLSSNLLKDSFLKKTISLYKQRVISELQMLSHWANQSSCMKKK